MIQGILLAIARFINNCFMVPMMKYAMRDQPSSAVGASQKEYVQSSSAINQMTVAAAMSKRETDSVENPDHFQSTFNGCLESGPILQMLMFSGSLISQGYPPDEALKRTFANAMHFGMYLQKQIGESA